MWLLTIEDYEGLTTFHRLAGERYTLGRALGNDFVLAQLNVSRRHARLERWGEGWAYVDEGSALGSYVNCGLVRAHEPTALGDGAVVQFGDYVLRLSKAELEGAPTPAPRYVAPARLRALVGPLAGREHVFGRNQLVSIGRSDDCTLRLVHESVSAVHAVLRPLADGRHELVDKSDNARLFVNGRRVLGEHLLEGGDAINVADVALFRYLEPCQQADPRFDEAWAERKGLTFAGASEAFGPRAPLVWRDRGGNRAGGESAAASDEAGVAPATAGRIEIVAATALPAPRLPSASFERLRKTTIGVGLVGARPNLAVVVGRESGRPAAAGSTVRLPWSAGALASALREGAAAAGDGALLAARSKGEAGGRAPGVDETPLAAPPVGSWWHRTRGALATAAASLLIAAAVGATAGLQFPAWTQAAEPEASVVALGGSPDDASADEGRRLPDGLEPAPLASAASAATVGQVVPAGPARAARPRDATFARVPSFDSAAKVGGGRRARLEARAKSGRASVSELRELLSLCQDMSDGRCVGDAHARLQQAQREP